MSFYDDDHFKEFSNWHLHDPFEFELPQNCKREGFTDKILCEHSEKALMLSKAALFGDKESFDLIAQENDQQKCKTLGRGIKPWDS